MRAAGGTNFGLAGSVVARTKSRIAAFAGPSFHDGRESVFSRCPNAFPAWRTRQTESAVRVNILCLIEFSSLMLAVCSDHCKPNIP